MLVYKHIYMFYVCIYIQVCIKTWVPGKSCMWGHLSLRVRWVGLGSCQGFVTWSRHVFS